MRADLKEYSEGILRNVKYLIDSNSCKGELGFCILLPCKCDGFNLNLPPFYGIHHCKAPFLKQDTNTKLAHVFEGYAKLKSYFSGTPSHIDYLLVLLVEGDSSSPSYHLFGGKTLNYLKIYRKGREFMDSPQMHHKSSSYDGFISDLEDLLLNVLLDYEKDDIVSKKD